MSTQFTILNTHSNHSDNKELSLNINDIQMCPYKNACAVFGCDSVTRKKLYDNYYEM